MDIRDVRGAVTRGWWLLVVGTLLGAAVAAGVSWWATPQYSSSTVLFVSATDAADVDAVQLGELYARERVDSYATALRSEYLARRVDDQLGLDLSPSQVSERISSVAVSDTVLIEVTVTDGSPARARDIADVLGQEFARWVTATETAGDAVGAATAVTVIQPAVLPTRPVSPDLGLNLGLGAALGVLLGLALAVWSRPSWTRVTSEDDVRRLTGAPLLGAVPATRPGDSGSAATAQRIAGGIRDNVWLVDGDGPPRVVVVAGVVGDDGASALAQDLADALALAHLSTGFIDAEGARRTGAPVRPGARGRAADVLAGPVAPGWEDGHDHVVVHAPSLGRSQEAALLAGRADGCVLAVRYGTARPANLAAATRLLALAGAKLLGVVLTDVPPAATVVRNPAHRYRADPERGPVEAARRAVLVAADGATVPGHRSEGGT